MFLFQNRIILWCNAALLISTEKRGASPSPSIPPISREQALLETFFHALSQFAFDKAKDQVVISLIGIFYDLLTLKLTRSVSKFPPPPPPPPMAATHFHVD